MKRWILTLLTLAACRTPAPQPVAIGAAVPAGATQGFLTLGRGFEYGRFALADTTPPGDHLVRVVRLDPAAAALRLEAATDGDRLPRVASGWAGDAPVVAVINASMFRTDHRTSLGYLRVGDHTQNADWAAEQNSLLGFGPVDGLSAKARLFNLGCADRDAAAAQYQSIVQSIRMLGCARDNVWAVDEKHWSVALTGADSSGRILLLFVQSPYTMHALVDQLLALPLDLVALHYGDGGPPASLYVRAPGLEERNVGGYETGAADNKVEWPFPNAIVATAGPTP